MYVWPTFGLMLIGSLFVCILEGLFIGEVTISWSSLNMNLKLFFDVTIVWTIFLFFPG